ncbi:hypothetical protein ACFL5G_02065 [Candidatus Margulisiibacteriota bacterium]
MLFLNRKIISSGEASPTSCMKRYQEYLDLHKSLDRPFILKHFDLDMLRTLAKAIQKKISELVPKVEGFGSDDPKQKAASMPFLPKLTLWENNHKIVTSILNDAEKVLKDIRKLVNNVELPQDIVRAFLPFDRFDHSSFYENNAFEKEFASYEPVLVHVVLNELVKNKEFVHINDKYFQNNLVPTVHKQLKEAYSRLRRQKSLSPIEQKNIYEMSNIISLLENALDEPELIEEAGSENLEIAEMPDMALNEYSIIEEKVLPILKQGPVTFAQIKAQISIPEEDLIEYLQNEGYKILDQKNDHYYLKDEQALLDQLMLFISMPADPKLQKLWLELLSAFSSERLLSLKKLLEQKTEATGKDIKKSENYIKECNLPIIKIQELEMKLKELQKTIAPYERFIKKIEEVIPVKEKEQKDLALRDMSITELQEQVPILEKSIRDLTDNGIMHKQLLQSGPGNKSLQETLQQIREQRKEQQETLEKYQELLSIKIKQQKEISEISSPKETTEAANVPIEPEQTENIDELAGIPKIDVPIEDDLPTEEDAIIDELMRNEEEPEIGTIEELPAREEILETKDNIIEEEEPAGKIPILDAIPEAPEPIVVDEMPALPALPPTTSYLNQAQKNKAFFNDMNQAFDNMFSEFERKSITQENIKVFLERSTSFGDNLSATSTKDPSKAEPIAAEWIRKINKIHTRYLHSSLYKKQLSKVEKKEINDLYEDAIKSLKDLVGPNSHGLGVDFFS